MAKLSNVSMTADDARKLTVCAIKPFYLEDYVADVLRYVRVCAKRGLFSSSFGELLRSDNAREWPEELTIELESLGYTVSGLPLSPTVSWS